MKFITNHISRKTRSWVHLLALILIVPAFLIFLFPPEQNFPEKNSLVLQKYQRENVNKAGIDGKNLGIAQDTSQSVFKTVENWVSESKR